MDTEESKGCSRGLGFSSATGMPRYVQAARMISSRREQMSDAGGPAVKKSSRRSIRSKMPNSSWQIHSKASATWLKMKGPSGGQKAFQGHSGIVGAVMPNLTPHRIWSPPVKLGNTACLIWPPPVKLGKPRLHNLASPLSN